MHQRLALFLVSCWALLFAQVVKAATLAEFMGAYDWHSLKWAALIALLGGSLRTIFSLQSDSRVVQEILKEALWDAGKALVAGMLTFVVVEAVRSNGVAVSSEIRFTAILSAGIFRMQAVTWLAELGKAVLDGFKSRIVGPPPPPGGQP